MLQSPIGVASIFSEVGAGVARVRNTVGREKLAARVRNTVGRKKQNRKS